MRSILLASVAVASLLASPVFAADQVVDVAPLSDAQFSIRLGAAYVDMDVANGLGSVNDTAAFDFISQSDNGLDISAVGIEGSVDYWQVGGLYLAADVLYVQDDTDQTIFGTAFLDTLPITGALSPGAIGIGDIGVSADADFLRVAAAGGYDLGSVVVGAYASYSRLGLNSAVVDIDSPGFINLDEQVDAYSLGPMVAVRRTLPISDSLEAFIDGRAALLYSHGSLDALQTASNLPVGGLSVKDSSNDLAGMIEARAGVNVLEFGGGKLSLYGGLGARNDVYKIKNPRSGPGVNAVNAASYNPGPAKLEQTLQLTATAGVKFSIPF